MFITRKEQKVGLPQNQPVNPMEYSSVPSISDSIPVDEYHIDFHYPEDRMTLLRVCVCLWSGSVHHCFSVAEFQGHLPSLLDPRKPTPCLTLSSASES